MALTLIGTPDGDESFDEIVKEHYRREFEAQTVPLKEWGEFLLDYAENTTR